MKPSRKVRREIQALIEEVQKHGRFPQDNFAEFIQAAKACPCKSNKSYGYGDCSIASIVSQIERKAATRFCKTCDRICNDAFCPVCDDGPFYYANNIQLVPNFVCCEQTQSTDYCCVCGQYQDSVIDAEPISLNHSRAKTQWRRDVPDLEALIGNVQRGSANPIEKEHMKALANRRYCRECKVVWDEDANRCAACACPEYVILQHEFDCLYHCGVEWPLGTKHCGKCGIKL